MSDKLEAYTPESEDEDTGTKKSPLKGVHNTLALRKKKKKKKKKKRKEPLTFPNSGRDDLEQRYPRTPLRSPRDVPISERDGFRSPNNRDSRSSPPRGGRGHHPMRRPLSRSPRRRRNPSPPRRRISPRRRSPSPPYRRPRGSPNRRERSPNRRPFPRRRNSPPPSFTPSPRGGSPPYSRFGRRGTSHGSMSPPPNRPRRRMEHEPPPRRQRPHPSRSHEHYPSRSDSFDRGPRGPYRRNSPSPRYGLPYHSPPRGPSPPFRGRRRRTPPRGRRSFSPHGTPPRMRDHSSSRERYGRFPPRGRNSRSPPRRQHSFSPRRSPPRNRFSSQSPQPSMTPPRIQMNTRDAVRPTKFRTRSNTPEQQQGSAPKHSPRCRRTPEIGNQKPEQTKNDKLNRSREEKDRKEKEIEARTEDKAVHRDLKKSSSSEQWSTEPVAASPTIEETQTTGPAREKGIEQDAIDDHKSPSQENEEIRQKLSKKHVSKAEKIEKVHKELMTKYSKSIYYVEDINRIKTESSLSRDIRASEMNKIDKFHSVIDEVIAKVTPAKMKHLGFDIKKGEDNQAAAICARIVVQNQFSYRDLYAIATKFNGSMGRSQEKPDRIKYTPLPPPLNKSKFAIPQAPQNLATSNREQQARSSHESSPKVRTPEQANTKARATPPVSPERRRVPAKQRPDITRSTLIKDKRDPTKSTNATTSPLNESGLNHAASVFVPMNNAPIRHSPPGTPAEEPYGTHEQQPYGLYNPVYKAPSDYHYNSLEESISHPSDSVLNDQQPHSGYSSAPSPQNFSTSDYPTSQWQHSPNQRNEYGYHTHQPSHSDWHRAENHLPGYSHRADPHEYIDHSHREWAHHHQGNQGHHYSSSQARSGLNPNASEFAPGANRDYTACPRREYNYQTILNHQVPIRMNPTKEFNASEENLLIIQKKDKSHGRKSFLQGFQKWLDRSQPRDPNPPSPPTPRSTNSSSTSEPNIQSGTKSNNRLPIARSRGRFGRGGRGSRPQPPLENVRALSPSEDLRRPRRPKPPSGRGRGNQISNPPLVKRRRGGGRSRPRKHQSITPPPPPTNPAPPPIMRHSRGRGLSKPIRGRGNSSRGRGRGASRGGKKDVIGTQSKANDGISSKPESGISKRGRGGKNVSMNRGRIASQMQVVRSTPSHPPPNLPKSRGGLTSSRGRGTKTIVPQRPSLPIAPPKPPPNASNESKNTSIVPVKPPQKRQPERPKVKIMSRECTLSPGETRFAKAKPAVKREATSPSEIEKPAPAKPAAPVPKEEAAPRRIIPRKILKRSTKTPVKNISTSTPSNAPSKKPTIDLEELSENLVMDILQSHDKDTLPLRELRQLTMIYSQQKFNESVFLQIISQMEKKGLIKIDTHVFVPEANVTRLTARTHTDRKLSKQLVVKAMHTFLENSPNINVWCPSDFIDSTIDDVYDAPVSTLFGVFPQLIEFSDMEALPSIQKFLEIAANTNMIKWKKLLRRKKSISAIGNKAKNFMKKIQWIGGTNSEHPSRRRGIVSQLGFVENVDPPRVRNGYICYVGRKQGKKIRLFYEVAEDPSTANPLPYKFPNVYDCVEFDRVMHQLSFCARKGLQTEFKEQEGSWIISCSPEELSSKISLNQVVKQVRPVKRPKVNPKKEKAPTDPASSVYSSGFPKFIDGMKKHIQAQFAYTLSRMDSKQCPMAQFQEKLVGHHEQWKINHQEIWPVKIRGEEIFSLADLQEHLRWYDFEGEIIKVKFDRQQYEKWFRKNKKLLRKGCSQEYWLDLEREWGE